MFEFIVVWGGIYLYFYVIYRIARACWKALQL